MLVHFQHHSTLWHKGMVYAVRMATLLFSDKSLAETFIRFRDGSFQLIVVVFGFLVRLLSIAT